MAAVLVYVSTTDGAADEVALQALALGSQLAAGGDVHAVVMGDAAAAATLGAWGATAVHVAEHPGLAAMAPDARARVIADLADRLGVDAIVGPGTEAGNTILARVAARADQPFAANCTAVDAGQPGGGDPAALGWQPLRGGGHQRVARRSSRPPRTRWRPSRRAAPRP